MLMARALCASVSRPGVAPQTARGATHRAWNLAAPLRTFPWPRARARHPAAAPCASARRPAPGAWLAPRVLLRAGLLSQTVQNELCEPSFYFEVIYRWAHPPGPQCL